MLDQKFGPSPLVKVFNVMQVAELIARAQVEYFVAAALPFDKELEDSDARATGGRGVPAVGGVGGADHATIGGNAAAGEGG